MCCGQIICGPCLSGYNCSIADNYFAKPCPYCKAKEMRTTIPKILMLFSSEIKVKCQFCQETVKNGNLQNHFIMQCRKINEELRKEMISFKTDYTIHYHPHVFKRMIYPVSNFNCIGSKFSKFQCRSGVKRKLNPEILIKSTNNENPLYALQCVECPHIFLCGDCWKFQKKIEIGIHHFLHSHLLYPVIRATNWLCNNKISPMCRSHNQSTLDYTFARFRCQTCDFDLCDICINLESQQNYQPPIQVNNQEFSSGASLESDEEADPFDNSFEVEDISENWDDFDLNREEFEHDLDWEDDNDLLD